MHVTQASQDYPNPAIPLVEDRSAWIRVFVVANQANNAAPAVQVQFINGSATNTLTINAPSATVPLEADPNANLSWNAPVPAGWIQQGTQIVATVDPLNVVAEADETNDVASDTPSVITLPQWRVTLIPIKTGSRTGILDRNGRTPADWVEFARRLYPMPDTVDVVAAPTFTSTSTTTLSSNGDGWDLALGDLRAKRVLDGATDRYYFGAVNVSYTSGVAGLGYIGYPAAIGWDYSGGSGGPSVLAHEEGHNFGRQHTPCGDPGSPDKNYPYPDGNIGVPGWDAFASSGNLKTDDYSDIMGYCSRQWISDYTYQGVLTFRRNNSPVVIAASIQSDAQEGLLISGEIENGRVTLQPAFRVPLNGTNIEPGPYLLEARDATGQILSSVNFDAAEIADLPGRSIRSFAFIAPLGADKINAVSSLAVLKDGRTIAQRAPTAVVPQAFKQARAAAEIQDLPNHALQISWNAALYPVVMLKDAKTGEVRGFLRGGSASVEDVPDQLELHFSDGVHSHSMLHQRTQP